MKDDKTTETKVVLSNSLAEYLLIIIVYEIISILLSASARPKEIS